VSVYVVGIIADGVQLVEQYYSKDKMDKLSENMPMILDLIVSSIKNFLNDSLKYLTIDEFTIAILTKEIEYSKRIKGKLVKSSAKINGYCIGDKTIFNNEIFTILKKITNNFIKQFYAQGSIPNYFYTNKYKVFKEEIKKWIDDLRYNPIERFKIGVI